MLFSESRSFVVVLPALPILKCHLQGNFLRLNSSSNLLVSWKIIPYSRPKLSDFSTLFESKPAENHTLHSFTYLYSSYMGVTPPPSPGLPTLLYLSWLLFFKLSNHRIPGHIKGVAPIPPPPPPPPPPRI